MFAWLFGKDEGFAKEMDIIHDEDAEREEQLKRLNEYKDRLEEAEIKSFNSLPECTEPITCPKCLGNAWTQQFVPLFYHYGFDRSISLTVDIKAAHMVLTCKRCGYEIKTKPADDDHGLIAREKK